MKRFLQKIVKKKDHKQLKHLTDNNLNDNLMLTISVSDNAIISFPPKSKKNGSIEEKQQESLSHVIVYKHLKLTKPIAKGSFGKVYLGKWNGLQVAIKEIKYDSDTIDYVNNEKNIMQKLNDLHAPNVVKFYGHSIHHNNCYFVMEYMSKESLFSIIQDNIPFNWIMRYKVMKDITNGIAFLHQNNITHCDIKSPNILLDENMNAKLCDFGLAKFTDTKQATDLMGTVLWLAPEIAKHEPYTTKADIFSLSIVFWELAAWKEPYTSLSAEAILDLIPTGTRETIPDTCPPKIAKLITWGWQAKPEDRPSAEEVLTELISISQPNSDRGYLH